MMKHLLTIVLCLTTLTGLAQEEKIKKASGGTAILRMPFPSAKSMSRHGGR